MSKAIIALILLVLTSFEGLEAQSIDCSRAFTRLEHAICSNPALEVLDAELSNLSEQAIALRIISEQGVQAMRNELAMRCSAAEEVDMCLVEQTLGAIAQLSPDFGPVVEIPASHHPQRRVGDLRAALQAGFQEAAEPGTVTDSEKALAKATFKLLDYYREAEGSLSSKGVRPYEVAALEAMVVRGCENLATRRAWQQVTQTRGHSCDSPLFVVNKGFVGRAGRMFVLANVP